MTKLSLLGAWALVSHAQAFQSCRYMDWPRWRTGTGPRQVHQNLNSALAAATSGNMADQHLQELALEWDHLKEELKEYARSATTQNKEITSNSLTTHFLTIALDYAHAKEEAEQEHVQQVHEHVERTLQQKDYLQMAVPLPFDNPSHWMMTRHELLPRQSHNKTADAEDYARQLASEHEAYQRQLYFHVASYSHPVYDYWQRQLIAIQQEEIQTREEEEEAQRVLEQMKRNEEILEATLAEFQALQQQQLTNGKTGQLPKASVESMEEPVLVSATEGDVDSGRLNGDSS